MKKKDTPSGRPSSSTRVGTRSAGFSPPSTSGRFERSTTSSSRRSYGIPRCARRCFFSSRRRHTRLQGDWSSDVCSSDLAIGLGRYKGKRDAVFADWSARIRELASCANVHVKLGGLGMRLLGFDVHEGELPPSSEQLAAAWRPYIETCITA